MSTIMFEDTNSDKSPSMGILLLATLGVFAGAAALIFFMGQFKPKAEKTDVDTKPPAKVHVISVVPKTERVSIFTQGSVSPVHSVLLASEIAGRVAHISPQYSDGGFFAKNEALVTIDDRDYQLSLRQARADVMKAEELFAIEQGRARQAKSEWRDIGNKDANDLFLRKPQLASAKAAIDAAQANYEKALLNIERTKISSPFNGRVQSKNVDIGQYVTPGTVIADVFSTESLQVRLPLTDKQVANVNLPLSANSDANGDLPDVTLRSVYGGKEFSWRGKIVRTEASFDLKSRVVYAVAEVETPYIQSDEKPPLSVGMYVSAEIFGKAVEKITRIPRRVLRKKNEIALVDKNNKIYFKNITVVQNDDDEILVTGLERGERLLLTKLPQTIAGLEVDPKTHTATVVDPKHTAQPNKS